MISGGIEVNQFAWIRSILEAKFGEDLQQLTEMFLIFSPINIFSD